MPILCNELMRNGTQSYHKPREHVPFHTLKDLQQSQGQIELLASYSWFGKWPTYLLTRQLTEL